MNPIYSFYGLMFFAGMMLPGRACVIADESDRTQARPLSGELHKKCVSILREGLKLQEFWPSMHAAEGLTAAGLGSEVIADLQNRLLTEKDDQRRCGLARELTRAGEEKYVQVLFDILGDLKSTGRTHAAESLYKLGKSGDRILLTDAMNQKDVLPLQIMAAGALAKAGDATAMTVLREQLKSQDPIGRNLSAWVLGRLGGSSDIRPILDAMEKEKDEMSRAFFSVSLACLGNADGRALLVTLLDSPNATAKSMAAEFAGISRTTEAHEKLVRLLDDSVADVRIRAAHSLIVLAVKE